MNDAEFCFWLGVMVGAVAAMSVSAIMLIVFVYERRK